MKSEKAQQYAYDRWDKEYCDLIRIGYAPGYSRNLDKLGITQDMLKELGLCDRNGNDLIRERITISIRDRFGRIIGFTCRNFDGSNPKYLNNADSDIFHKGEVLFGIDAASGRGCSRLYAFTVYWRDEFCSMSGFCME